MTISSTTRKAGPYVGNGSATSFAFTFKVFTTADVVVTKTTLATGAESVLVLTTDYTVTLNGDQNTNPGGSVKYNPSGTPMASTHSLTLTSAVAQTQGTDIPSAGGWYPEVVEDALDKSTILTQQITEVVNRTIRFPVAESGAVQLPAAAQRKNKLLGFDTNGDPAVYSTDTSIYGVLRDYQIATAGQTVFNLGYEYSIGSNAVAVFVNGLRQRIAADFTESGVSQVTFAYGLQEGDEAEFFGGQEQGSVSLAAVTATATSIADKTSSVNLASKYAGRVVYDSTNKRVMVADGAADVDKWYVADGSANVTPA